MCGWWFNSHEGHAAKTDSCLVVGSYHCHSNFFFLFSNQHLKITEELWVIFLYLFIFFFYQVSFMTFVVHRLFKIIIININHQPVLFPAKFTVVVQFYFVILAEKHQATSSCTGVMGQNCRTETLYNFRGWRITVDSKIPLNLKRKKLERLGLKVLMHVIWLKTSFISLQKQPL